MTRNFCTRTAEKFGRLGCEKKLARRLAQFCYIEMILVCGMFGFFDIFGSGIPPIRSSPAVTTSFWIPSASARVRNASSALSFFR